MIDTRKIITRNRQYFHSQPLVLSDQKSVDLSSLNIRLEEIVELMIWSTLSGKNNKKQKK